MRSSRQLEAALKRQRRPFFLLLAAQLICQQLFNLASLKVQVIGYKAITGIHYTENALLVFFYALLRKIINLPQ